MADRILTFQQSSVMQDIETALDLVKRGASSQQIREVFDGILLLVEDEGHLYPPELLPSSYFSDRVIFGNRTSLAVARLYLHKLHRHLDLRSASTLSG